MNANTLERRRGDAPGRRIETLRRELEPEERVALALERLADVLELLGDRAELVLELLPIRSPEDLAVPLEELPRG